MQISMIEMFDFLQIKLETLIVAGNLLTYLPETLANLKNLKELDAHQNHIKVFPRSVNNFLGHAVIEVPLEQSIARLSQVHPKAAQAGHGQHVA